MKGFILLMRVFVAIEFDNEFKKVLKNIQKQIKEYTINGRWTYSDNLHLTLKFLGEVKDKDIENIKNAIDRACIDIECFNISINKLDFFANNSNLQVVWLGMKFCRELFCLHNLLEAELSMLGFDKELRKFSPHITIGRNISLFKDFQFVENQIKVFT